MLFLSSLRSLRPAGSLALVILTACGGDPRPDPTPDAAPPERDAAVDASRDAGGDAGTDTGVAPDAGALCADRTGGALVTLDLSGESFTFWTTNDDFIDAAAEFLAAGGQGTNVHFALRDGTDCDVQWSWHPDPEDVYFADISIEVCDGRPSDVEGDKTYWFETVGQYCPWGVVVTAVDDRR